MKLNPYVAAGLMAVLACLPGLNEALRDGHVSLSELVSVIGPAVAALSAALHIEPPQKGSQAPVEPVVIPMDVEPKGDDV